MRRPHPAAANIQLAEGFQLLLQCQQFRYLVLLLERPPDLGAGCAGRPQPRRRPGNNNPAGGPFVGIDTQRSLMSSALMVISVSRWLPGSGNQTQVQADSFQSRSTPSGPASSGNAHTFRSKGSTRASSCAVWSAVLPAVPAIYVQAGKVGGHHNARGPLASIRIRRCNPGCLQAKAASSPGPLLQERR